MTKVAEAAVGDLDGVAATIHGLADLAVIGVVKENLIVALGIDGLGQAVVLINVVFGDPAQGVGHLDERTIGLGALATGCAVGSDTLAEVARL